MNVTNGICINKCEKFPNCKPCGEMKYYIQNRDRGFLGNSFVFWAKGSNGYTAKLDKAEQFSFDEAKKICKGNPTKNKAWEVDYIDNNEGTSRLTDSQYLEQDKIVEFD